MMDAAEAIRAVDPGHDGVDARAMASDKPTTLKEVMEETRKKMAEGKEGLRAAIKAVRPQLNRGLDELREKMGSPPKVRPGELDVLRALCAEQMSPENMVKDPYESVSARGVAIERGAFDIFLDSLIKKHFIQREADDYVRVMPSGFAAGRLHEPA